MQVIEETKEGSFLVWCPGCKTLHEFDKRWTFDGNHTAPTFNPSLLVRGHLRDGTVFGTCHSFVREGRWQFLGDSTHELAGKTVDMVDVNGP